MKKLVIVLSGLIAGYCFATNEVAIGVLFLFCSLLLAVWED